MIRRTANVQWTDTLKKGSGTLELGSGSFRGSYSFGSRFGDSAGTNPDELIGAANAGCFSMALALMLEEAGFPPKTIDTSATVSLDPDQSSITTIELNTTADVPGIDEAKFQEVAQQAKEGCPVSKALSGVDIKLKARLK